MKQIVFKCILAIVCCVQFTTAQQFDYTGDGYGIDPNLLIESQIVGNPTVQSPDVAAFQKVNHVPVSNYTGRANISIPIYEIKVGAMSVPISISYNSSGVKVGDMPSNVGTNWALNAGGMVTRTIKGIDDYNIPRRPGLSPSWYEKGPAGWTGLLAQNVESKLSKKQQHDPAPDIYTANAPGLSTKYIHSKVRSNQVLKPNPIEIENNGNIIDEVFGKVKYTFFNDQTLQFQTSTRRGMKSIKITSTKGIVYDFVTPELSRYHSKGWHYVTPVIWKFDSYRLDRMYDPSTNQTITFEYEQYSNYFHDVFITGKNQTNYTVYPLTNRLKKINFDKGTVEFIYGFNRLDNPGDKALTEIKVKNHLGHIIKRIKFDYSYFVSNVFPAFPQSKRLRLNKIYRVNKSGTQLPGHTFTYNTSIDMPPRNFWGHDFLGYNNGSYTSSNTNPSPKLYFNMNAYDHNYNSTDNEIFTIGTPFSGVGRILLSGNYSLEANENASKAYILTKVQYPTGGFSEFEYESNRFNGHIGGGLRIASQKLVDEYGQEQILDYTYGSGYINKMPTFVNFKLADKRTSVNRLATSADQLNVHYETYNVPQNQVELTNGSFVGYGSVTIKNRFNNGKTFYNYHNSYRYPNTPSTKTFFGPSSGSNISKSWRALGHYSLWQDRDILRGKLSRKEVVDNNGMLKLSEEYKYSLKEFRSLNLKFMNKISYESKFSNCDNDGIYMRGCGGYDERVAFPIERNLLTSITTIEFPRINDDKGYREEPKQIYKTQKRYVYDSQLPLIKSESQGVYPCVEENENFRCDNSQSKYINRLYRYASSSSLLGAQNRLSTPISMDIDNIYEGLKHESHSYKNFGNGIINLQHIKYYERDRKGRTPVTVTQRDRKGNILEIKSERGIYTSFIFGYGSRYMICELENVRYTDMLAALTGSGSSITQISNSNTDSQIKSITNQLRNTLKDGRITSYTYKPLVGATSSTDIRGRETSYEYDSFNRLILVKDHDQNVLSKNTYSYKN